MTLTIRTLAPDDEAGFAAAYAIYADALEKTEQRTRTQMQALLVRPDYRFLVAERDGAMIGMTAAWRPEAGDIWLFEYAAVAPQARGGGVGASLFLACVGEAGPGRVGLVEVDSDRAGDAAQNARRLAFYGRLGCRVIQAVDYLLPLDAFGTPPPMLLLAHAPGAKRSVTREVVETWLRRIYVGAYGKRADDPRIAAMTRSLPETVRLLDVSDRARRG
jgi:GNAT superfamily N-acetyltransferase